MRGRAKGMLKALMLGIVIQEGRVHGYRVYKRLMGFGAGRWRPSIGTIYRTLCEMVEEGLLEREEEARGGRVVAYYTPTERGIGEFLERSRVFLERMELGLSLLTATLKRLRSLGVADRVVEERMKNLYDLLQEYLG